MKKILLAIISVCVATLANAADTVPVPVPVPAVIDNTAGTRSTTPLEESLGKYFGFGLAVLSLPEKNVESAEVRGGVVRVTDESITRVTPWLQTQYIFDGAWDRNSYIKPGIFMGIGLSSSGNSLETFGIGVMLSMKRKAWSVQTDTSSLNIGIGVYSTKYKTLANDTPEGKSLPTGIESPQYINKNQSGVMLNFSFSI